MKTSQLSVACAYLIKIILPLFFIFLTSSVNAATVVYDGNDVTDILGLDVNGSTWNVNFVNGAASASEWSTQLEALNAEEAIISLFNAESSIPSTIKDDLGIQSSFFRVLFPLDLSNNVYTAGYGGTAWANCCLQQTVNGTFASFSVVPIPAAAWLFASALAGLGWIRRRSAT